MEIFAPDYNSKPLHVSAYGNAWVEDYTVPQSIAEADKVYFGIIPGGVRITQVQAPEGITLGYEPAEGDTQVAGTFAELTPVTFDRPVKLVGTATAAVSGGAVVLVTGKVVGVP